jgi:hypothetical protein
MSKELEVEEYLLLSCLCGGKPNIGRLSSAKRYLKKHERQVQAACAVAEWLGLVTLADEGVLGWTPTAMLVDHLLQRGGLWNQSIRQQGPAPHEKKVFIMILESALKNFDGLGDCDEYVQRFLAFLGLMERTDDDEWYPTRRLINLAAERSKETAMGRAVWSNNL